MFSSPGFPGKDEGPTNHPQVPAAQQHEEASAWWGLRHNSEEGVKQVVFRIEEYDLKNKSFIEILCNQLCIICSL